MPRLRQYVLALTRRHSCHTRKAKRGGLRVDFDNCLKLEFQCSKITSDAVFIAYRELDDALGLTHVAGELVADPRSGRNAVKWTRLLCRTFRNNDVRLQLHALAYNLANFMRILALPKEIEHWPLTSLRDKPVKIRARFVAHGRYIPSRCRREKCAQMGENPSEKGRNAVRWDKARSGGQQFSKQLRTRDHAPIM